MMVVRCVLFVFSLCLAWCSVAMATKDATNDEAIEKVKKKAIEGFDWSDKAMARELAVVLNASALLRTVDQAAAAVIISVGEEEKNYKTLPSNVQEAVDSLVKKLSEARDAVQRVKTMRTTFKGGKMDHLTDKFREKMLSGVGSAAEAIELKEMADRAAAFWEESATFFDSQLSAVQEADRKAKVAMEAANAAANVISGVNERTAENIKRRVFASRDTLQSLNKESPLVTAAEEVKKIAQEAPKFLKEAAGVFIAQNDVQVEEGEKKLPEKSSAVNTTGKPTADTGESNKNDPTTDNTTAAETTTDETGEDNATPAVTKEDNTTRDDTTTNETTTTETGATETTTHNGTRDNTTIAEAKAEDMTENNEATNRHSQGSSLPHASVLAISGVAVTSVLLLLARVVAGMASV